MAIKNKVKLGHESRALLMTTIEQSDDLIDLSQPET
jgi:hypothetical protein